MGDPEYPVFGSRAQRKSQMVGQDKSTLPRGGFWLNARVTEALSREQVRKRQVVELARNFAEYKSTVGNSFQGLSGENYDKLSPRRTVGDAVGIDAFRIFCQAIVLITKWDITYGEMCCDEKRSQLPPADIKGRVIPDPVWQQCLASEYWTNRSKREAMQPPTPFAENVDHPVAPPSRATTKSQAASLPISNASHSVPSAAEIPPQASIDIKAEPSQPFSVPLETQARRKRQNRRHVVYGVPALVGVGALLLAIFLAIKAGEKLTWSTTATSPRSVPHGESPKPKPIYPQFPLSKPTQPAEREPATASQVSVAPQPSDEGMVPKVAIPTDIVLKSFAIDAHVEDLRFNQLFMRLFRNAKDLYEFTELEQSQIQKTVARTDFLAGSRIYAHEFNQTFDVARLTLRIQSQLRGAWVWYVVPDSARPIARPDVPPSSPEIVLTGPLPGSSVVLLLFPKSGIAPDTIVLRATPSD